MSTPADAWKNHKQPLGYEKKFAGFIGMIAHAKKQGIQTVLIAWPWILGDNYEEMTESLSRLAEAGLALSITGRYDHERDGKG